MTNCIKFCKERNKVNSAKTIKENAWENAIEYNPNMLLSKELSGFSDIGAVFKTEQDGNITVHTEYNPNANFSYYTQYVCTHDGTLSFLLEGMAECLERILTGGTYDNQVGLPDLSKNSIFNYTIGNFVIVSEHGNFSKDKPWLQEKSTIMLPIKFSWEYGK